jgi:uncharacterized protein (DUF2141 family)
MSSAARMTTLGLTILLLWLAPQAASAANACNPDDPNQVRLQISVSAMRTTRGDITITIYPDDPKHFLDGKYKLARQHIPVTVPVSHACFAFSVPGSYAVALFGDENQNGHFDTNFLGIPIEGYGFSNNPALLLGPPSLAKVRIAAHAGDNPIAIQMKYY